MKLIVDFNQEFEKWGINNCFQENYKILCLQENSKYMRGIFWYKYDSVNVTLWILLKKEWQNDFF